MTVPNPNKIFQQQQLQQNPPQDILDLAVIGTPLSRGGYSGTGDGARGRSAGVDDGGGSGGVGVHGRGDGERLEDQMEHLNISAENPHAHSQHSNGGEHSLGHGHTTEAHARYTTLHVRVDSKDYNPGRGGGGGGGGGGEGAYASTRTNLMQMKTISHPERVQGRVESLTDTPTMGLGTVVSPEDKESFYGGEEEGGRGGGEEKREVEVRVLSGNKEEEEDEGEGGGGGVGSGVDIIGATKFGTEKEKQEQKDEEEEMRGKMESESGGDGNRESGSKKEEIKEPSSSSSSSSASSSKKLSISDFELLAVLGRGAYGKVFQVKRKSTGVIYAMKVGKEW